MADPPLVDIDPREVEPRRPPVGSGTPRGTAPVVARGVEERVVGRAIAFLLTNRQWIHRRTEYIHFVDADTVRRQMGVDYTLPLNRQTAELYSLRPGLVPLATLEKRGLLDFSVWDEDGRRIPILNTLQNGAYAAAALVATARGTAALYKLDEVPEPINVLLRLVASRPTDEACDALGALRKGLGAVAMARKNAWKREPGVGDYLERFEAHADLSRMLFNGPGAGAADKRPSIPDRRVQDRASRALDSLAEQLASQFIVLAELRGDDPDRRARRLLKFAYEQPPDAYRPQLSWDRRMRRWCRRGLETLSLWPKHIQLDAVPVGNAASYHVEIVAPDDIELLAARIVAEDPERRADKPVKRESTSTERQRVHLQVSAAPRAAVGPLWVELRAERSGFLRAALLTSVLVAVLLNAGRGRLDEITAPEQGSSLEAAATLLVAIPGIVSAYLLRPGEHLMASRLLFGPKLFLLLSAACAFVAAGSLAGAYESETRDDLWSSAADASIVLGLALALSYVMPIVVPIARRCWRAVTRDPT